MRVIMPLILLVASVGLFIVYTNPTYQTIKGLQAEQAQYNEALTQSSQLRQLRDSLLQKQDAFSPQDLTNLEHMLPDSVDNIRLIININDIAARDGLGVSNVSLSTGDSQSADQSGSLASGPVGSVGLSFSVTATYPQFLQFLNDLEHSLRLIDVNNIKFTAGSSPISNYTLQVETYWLR